MCAHVIVPRFPGLYFILPFIFSTVYNNYKTILEQTEQYYVARRKRALLSAFNQMDRGLLLSSLIKAPATHTDSHPSLEQTKKGWCPWIG